MTRSRAPILAAVLLLAAAGCAPTLRFSPADVAARPAPPASDRYRVVVVGDTQQMPPVDWVMRGGPKVRARVHDEIRALAPDVVLHAGDIVGNGSYGPYWADFRQAFADVPIWPVLGNHDLFGSNDGALASYYATFPQVAGRRWYALRFPPLAFLMLDSNFGDMTDEEARAEKAWLAAELDRAEADRDVRGIVLVTHHPPLSTQIGGGSEAVRRAFFDEAAKRSKFMVFLSGHHHAYQHIEMGGRHAFVTGGGGAPLLLWRCGKLPAGARLVAWRESHNVLELEVGPDGLRAVMHELSPETGAWRVGEECAIPWPATP